MTRPWWASSSATSATAASRPTKLVSCTARLWGWRSRERRGGKPERQVGVGQLVDLLGAAQVTHPVGAEVDQAGPGRQVVGHQVGGRPRDEDLAAVAEVAQPARPGDGLAEVADLVPQLRLPGAQPHPRRGRPCATSSRWTSRAQASASDARAKAATNEPSPPASTCLTPR